MELTFSKDRLTEAATHFIEEMGSSRVFAFHGEMGAGKTTFISEVCRLLGAPDDLGSPTFSLINEYADKDGNPIYHFDFYRVESPQEVMDIGIEDYFYSGSPCFIEWPEIVDYFLPEDTREIEIKVNPDGSRTIKG